MNEIKTWILSICVFSVIIALYKLLLPAGNIRRAGEVVFSLLLLLLITVPLAGIAQQDYTFFAETDNIFSAQAQSTEIRPYKQAVEKAVADSLNARQIAHGAVTANMNIENDTSIVIYRVSVELQDATDDETVRQAITEDTMISAEVITITRKE